MGGYASVPFKYDEQLLSDTELQSTVVKDSATEDSSDIRRALNCDELTSLPKKKDGSDIVSIWDAFAYSVSDKGFENNQYLGSRVFDDTNKGSYVWQTYKQIYDQAIAVGFALVSNGHSANDNIGFFAVNRAEWIIAALGVWSQNMRVVALYATLGADVVEYISNFSEISTMFVSKNNLSSIVSILDKFSTLKTLIMFDVDAEKYGNTSESLDEETVRVCQEKGVSLQSFVALIAEGVKIEGKVCDDVTADSISHIMFTSGTTGKPKGALISHGNVLTTVYSLGTVVLFTPADIHISYLPLAHIFETLCQVCSMLEGSSVGFFQGDVKKLTADFIALRPTVLVGVPRVFTKIYQKVFATVGSKNCATKYVFHKGYSTQADAIRNKTARSVFFDKKVFEPLAEKVGLDRCRLIGSGAAPLPSYLAEFLKIVVKCSVLQGYGLTETAGGLSLTLEGDNTIGHVGPPASSCEVKLQSIPEMNYDAKADLPKGEVLVRGPGIFKGYLKNEKATSEMVSSEGWLSTGDVGRWNPNGTLSIIDRKKNIFKMSQGEYIAAEHLEAVYGKCALVGQIWAYGNSFKSFVLGVVVPSADRIVEIAQSKGYWTHDTNTIGSKGFSSAFAELWSNNYKELKQILVKELKQQEETLKGFEKFRDIHIESEINELGVGFTEENECMTPTFKLRRPFLLKRYRTQLRQLYTDNGEPPAADEKWPGED